MARRGKKSQGRARSGPFRSAQVSTMAFRDTIVRGYESALKDKSDPKSGTTNHIDLTAQDLLPSLQPTREFVIEKVIVEAIPLFPSTTNFDCTAQVQAMTENPNTGTIILADAPYKMLNSTIPTQLGCNFRKLSKRAPYLLVPYNTGNTTAAVRIQFGPGMTIGDTVNLRITTVVSIFPQTAL